MLTPTPRTIAALRSGARRGCRILPCVAAGTRHLMSGVVRVISTFAGRISGGCTACSQTNNTTDENYAEDDPSKHPSVEPSLIHSPTPDNNPAWNSKGNVKSTLKLRGIRLRVRTHKPDSHAAHFLIQGSRRGTCNGSGSFLAGGRAVRPAYAASADRHQRQATG